MKYTVLTFFTDLQDNCHEYRTGDEFPRTGVKVSEARIKELLTSENKRGIPLISAVGGSVTENAEEATEKPEEAPQEAKTDVNPPKALKAPRRAKKKQE